MQALVLQAEKVIQGLEVENLSLDMSRGKPSTEQLALSQALLGNVSAQELQQILQEDGLDLRNYGGLEGLPEMQEFFRQMLELPPSVRIIVGGNSSLALMHNVLSLYQRYGVSEARPSWHGQQSKFICPVPGYDRHFAICEHLGVEMIAVAMREDGPDMDAVEALVRSDNSIKGMWCVPKYSNPTGAIYSDAVMKRLACMPTAAEGFRLFWDNAYAVHSLDGVRRSLADVFSLSAQAGHPNRVVMFGSTSKITFAGAGVAAIASSEENVRYLLGHFSKQTIGPDKINQYRHAKFFAEHDLWAHMQAHARLLKPKFEYVQAQLQAHLADTGLASWTRPKGGYFIQLQVLSGCAQAVVSECARLGLKLTPAGATFPYGYDVCDCNIRLAPSFLTMAQLEKAMAILIAVVQKICGQHYLKALN